MSPSVTSSSSFSARRHSRVTVLSLLALCALTLSSCSPFSAESAASDDALSGSSQSAEKAVPAWLHLAELPAPLDRAELTDSWESQESDPVELHWLTGMNMPALDEKVRETAGALVPDSADATISWSVPVASGHILAERLTAGPDTTGPSATLWVDVSSGEVTGSADLLTDTAAAELSEAATAVDPVSFPAGMSVSTDDIILTRDGSMYVSTPIAATQSGPSSATLRIDASHAKELLNEAGKSFLETVSQGEPFAGFPVSALVDGRIGEVATEDVDCTVAKCIALTFDDGPDPQTTPRLLDILSEKKVHATFFMIGPRAQANPEIVQRVQAGGHTIGSHTWNHPELPTLGWQEINNEVSSAKQAISEITGGTPVLMRPPYGAVNGTVLDVLAHTGDAAILWNVDTLDWKFRDPENVKKLALEGAAPGAVILMHDIHATTVEAVPSIIDELRSRGYTLVSVPTLLGKLDSGKIYGTW